MTEQFRTTASDDATILRLAERVAKEAHDLPAYASDDERGVATIVAGLALLEKTRSAETIAQELIGLADLYVRELGLEGLAEKPGNIGQQTVQLLRAGIHVIVQRGMTAPEACEAFLWAAGRLLSDLKGVRESSEAAYRLADALAAAEH